MRTRKRLKLKLPKTNNLFAAGFLILAGNISFAQIPKDTLKYYEWKEVQNANPDTIYAIDFTREKMGAIPEKLFQFEHLKGLKLTKNKLETLPESFKEFEELKFLYLDKNDFTYFPSQVFHLDNLVYLDMSRNKMGSIPKGIKNLKKLKYLDVWDNRFTNIDPAFSELQQLEYIDLRGTTFSPSFVEKWTKAFPNATVEFDSPCDCLE